MDFELISSWSIESHKNLTKDKGELPLALFLDLSKSLDTLNHEIPLTKLRHYGILSKPGRFFSKLFG